MPFPKCMSALLRLFLSTLWKHAKPEKEKPLDYIPICSNPLCLNAYCNLRYVKISLTTSVLHLLSPSGSFYIQAMPFNLAKIPSFMLVKITQIVKWAINAYN